MTTPAGGRGRGLSTILTGSSIAPPHRGTTTDRLIERALTEMASRGPLRACGHLDDPLGDAELTLRSPDLGSLHPTEAYQLFSALRGVDVRSPGRHDLEIGAYPAMAVVVETQRRRGLWFFGDDRLDEAAVERLAQLAEAYGPAVCDHRPATADASPIDVEVSGCDAAWSVEVTFGSSDAPEGEAKHGSGSGPNPIDAAVAAAMEAVDLEPTRVETDLVIAEDGSMVVVVLGLGSMLALGGAEIEAPGDEVARAVAAAAAARRAAHRLIPG